MRSEKNLRAVIKLLRRLAANGMMDQGQEKAIEKSINKLRRAYRSHDPVRLWKATDHVVQIFLRTHNE